MPVPPEKRWAARRRFMSGGLVYLLVIGGRVHQRPGALGLSGLIGIYYIFERTPTLSAVGDADDEAGQDA